MSSARVEIVRGCSKRQLIMATKAKAGPKASVRTSLKKRLEVTSELVDKPSSTWLGKSVFQMLKNQKAIMEFLLATEEK